MVDLVEAAGQLSNPHELRVLLLTGFVFVQLLVVVDQQIKLQNFPAGLKSITDRHIEVQQNHVIGCVFFLFRQLDLVECLLSIGGLVNLSDILDFLESSLDEEQLELVVIGDEYLELPRRKSGYECCVRYDLVVMCAELFFFDWLKLELVS